jgi:glycosyltransferase involved in cell wall biosynthesis
MKSALLFSTFYQVNPYPFLFEKILKAEGWTVQTEHSLPIPKTANPDVVFLSWFEEYPLFVPGGGVFSKVMRSISRTAQAFAFLLSLRLRRIPIIFIQHNVKSQSDSALKRLFVVSLINFLKSISTAIVVHSAADEFSKELKYEYIPHPLYPTRGLAPNAKLGANPTALVFGRIQESKKLDQLINEWPDLMPLEIFGWGWDQNLLKRMRDAANDKPVKIVEERLSEDELDKLLRTSDVLVVPRDGEDAIVSGTFFHGISYGCLVIARHSAAMHAISTVYPFLYTFTDAESLQNCLEKAQLEIEKGLTRQTVIESAAKTFGDKVVGHHLNLLINSCLQSK